MGNRKNDILFFSTTPEQWQQYCSKKLQELTAAGLQPIDTAFPFHQLTGYG